MHSIAQMSASISEWSGNIGTFLFLAPHSPSKPSNVLYQSCPEYVSLCFHDPSVKHYPGMEAKAVACSSLF